MKMVNDIPLILVLLDLITAFGTVNHNILLNRLRCLDLSGPVLVSLPPLRSIYGYMLFQSP